jgi:inorganic triphosphatase YgiF
MTRNISTLKDFVTHKKMRMVKQLTRFRYLFGMLQTMMPKYDKKRADVLQQAIPHRACFERR